jgi:anti-sigma B factor antagonist
MSGQRAAAVDGQLTVDARRQRRTALVALHGELDLMTAPKVSEAIDLLDPSAGGIRHIVLDLRGLTFMDVRGMRELLSQGEYARVNRHNLAIVRGSAIDRVMGLTGGSDALVIVDDPDDLSPPHGSP